MGTEKSLASKGSPVMNVYGTVRRFTTADEGFVVDFPRVQEWESSQRIQVSRESWYGADYGPDLWGRGVSPVQTASERVRLMSEHGEIDQLRSSLQYIGRGKLWVELHDGSIRWAWCRLSEMPSMNIQVDYISYTPIILEFQRYSDWYSESPSQIIQNVTASPTDINVNSNGLAITRNIVITLLSNTFAGWNAPRIENLTTGESFTINRTGSTGMYARVNVMGYRLEHSLDGLTWVDDSDRLSLGGTQAGVLSFPPQQLSVLRVTNCSNATITVRYYHAWR